MLNLASLNCTAIRQYGNRVLLSWLRQADAHARSDCGAEGSMSALRYEGADSKDIDHAECGHAVGIQPRRADTSTTGVQTTARGTAFGSTCQQRSHPVHLRQLSENAARSSGKRRKEGQVSALRRGDDDSDKVTGGQPTLRCKMERCATARRQHFTNSVRLPRLPEICARQCFRGRSARSMPALQDRR